MKNISSLAAVLAIASSLIVAKPEVAGLVEAAIKGIHIASAC